MTRNIDPRRQRARMAVLAGLCALSIHSASAQAAPEFDKLEVPPGFTVEVLSAALPNARQLALGAAGTLFAGTQGDGHVWALSNGTVTAVAADLTMPSGIAYHQGDLYIGAVDTIFRLDDIEDRLDTPPAPVVITDALPSDAHHGWKHIEFDPQGNLWVPVGAPCNICEPEDPYTGLLKMDPNTGSYQIVARGIRNTVGFDFEPGTGALWFTDNGRDMLGDDIPACELNKISSDGQHFGYPYIHGADVVDPEFGAGHSATDYVPPEFEMQAHTAPLGIAFYDAQAFPAAYQGALFIAQHGSWNRSSKVGYQVIVAYMQDGRVTHSEPFLTGFLEDEKAWGRPVDVLVDADGALLVSDDQAGAVYRIRYVGEPVAGN